jgi:hypothetical protein
LTDDGALTDHLDDRSAKLLLDWAVRTLDRRLAERGERLDETDSGRRSPSIERIRRETKAIARWIAEPKRSIASESALDPALIAAMSAIDAESNGSSKSSLAIDHAARLERLLARIEASL